MTVDGGRMSVLERARAFEARSVSAAAAGGGGGGGDRNTSISAVKAISTQKKKHKSVGTKHGKSASSSSGSSDGGSEIKSLLPLLLLADLPQDAAALDGSRTPKQKKKNAPPSFLASAVASWSKVDHMRGNSYNVVHDSDSDDDDDDGSDEDEESNCTSVTSVTASYTAASSITSNGGDDGDEDDQQGQECEEGEARHSKVEGGDATDNHNENYKDNDDEERYGSSEDELGAYNVVLPLVLNSPPLVVRSTVSSKQGAAAAVFPTPSGNGGSTAQDSESECESVDTRATPIMANTRRSRARGGGVDTRGSRSRSSSGSHQGAIMEGVDVVIMSADNSHSDNAAYDDDDDDDDDDAELV
eukprot:CAMPEP_0178712260 /NCGR_PEP_ID=MMETSP0699-20121125/18788_1 /TAXON_ID=265572 /ORGANISM="Extubocellulus spinifer, Strain CCMP396" /LENGTH=357 /DNA_ID=CAMNT_0020361001 /DNA_START=15 /DNA_END=1085 /DNA_ORIENTATION=+